MSQAWSYILLLPAPVALLDLYKLGADCGEGERYPSPGIYFEVLEISLFFNKSQYGILFGAVLLGTMLFRFLTE